MSNMLLRTIEGLRAGIAIEPPHRSTAATGLAGVDDALGGGLVCGLHEWFGLVGADESVDTRSLPLELPVFLAGSVRRADQVAPWVVYVGRRCFQYPSMLANGRLPDRRSLDRSLFVHATTATDRLWSIEQAIGSSAVGVVIADGSRFNLAATRRLQLGAQTHRTFVFLVRPHSELNQLSAAQTRWLVRYERSGSAQPSSWVNPCWRLELLRCKGSFAEQGCWIVERDRASRTLCVSAAVVHPADDAAVVGEVGVAARRTA